MKDKVPGVGSSIGLDRLIAGLEQLGKLEHKKSHLSVEIFCLDEKLSIAYQTVANKLRSAGISCEVFPDPKKIAAQYTMAEKKGIPFGMLIKEEDVEKGVVTLKNLQTREQFDSIPLEQAISILQNK